MAQSVDFIASNFVLVTAIYDNSSGCNFWATLCKTVHLVLSDRCLSVCLSVLSVTFLYCGQTVGRIKIKLGTQVGLGPGHIV